MNVGLGVTIVSVTTPIWASNTALLLFVPGERQQIDEGLQLLIRDMPHAALMKRVDGIIELINEFSTSFGDPRGHQATIIVVP